MHIEARFSDMEYDNKINILTIGPNARGALLKLLHFLAPPTMLFKQDMLVQVYFGFQNLLKNSYIHESSLDL